MTTKQRGRPPNNDGKTVGDVRFTLPAKVYQQARRIYAAQAESTGFSWPQWCARVFITGAVLFDGLDTKAKGRR